MIVSLKGHSLNFVVKQRPLLFYPQEWYRVEKFAQTPHTGEFDTDGVCPAVVYALAYVKHFDRTGEILWASEWRWTCDEDNEGHKVYVGRVGQYGGFQVHRHLKEAPV